MRGKQLIIGLFSIGALAGAGACGRTYEAPGEVVPANAVGVVVKNQNFLDMDIYAVSDGMRTRLGTVTGNTTGSFIVNPSMATQDFRIIATPIGGTGLASTGNLSISAGETIEFTVGSTLANSSVFIR